MMQLGRRLVIMYFNYIMDTLREITLLQLSILQTVFNHPELAQIIKGIVDKDDELYANLLKLVSKLESL